jgi:hypothetical protein
MRETPGARLTDTAVAMSMSFEVTSGAGAAISLVLVTLLFFAWLIALFMLLVDSISVGAKILWFIVLTCLAPVAIPVYFVLRHRRHRPEPSIA